MPVKIKKAHGHSPVRPVQAREDQRLAMYIVISNPKRMSVKAGVVHCIVVVSSWLA
jgi:hypothetical protein